MSLHQISITLGPKDTLQSVLDKYPKKNIKMLKDAGDSKRYMLLDLSDEDTVFHSNLDYQVIERLESDFPVGLDNNFVECRYLTLDAEEQKVFKSNFESWYSKGNRPMGLKTSILCRLKSKNFEFLLLNLWDEEHEFLLWNDAHDNIFKNFGHGGNAAPIIKAYRFYK